MRILVVDDGEEVQRIREKLAPRGIEVAGAFCADDAFRIWQSEGSWDMVLTEYDIAPGKRMRDATELMKAIHAANPAQRIAIHTSDERLQAGSLLALRKPYPIDRLIRALRLPVLPLRTLLL
jgi:DNA-binding NtrC family response regulator